MNTDQLEALGEIVARTVKSKFALDYIRFDAGSANIEQPIPWATLFISKRGFINPAHHEFPLSQVHQWLTVPEEQAKEMLYAAFEARVMLLVKEAPEEHFLGMHSRPSSERKVSTLLSLVTLMELTQRINVDAAGFIENCQFLH
jgi:hypothetical protein